MKDVVTKVIINPPVTVVAAKGGNGLVRGAYYKIVAITWKGRVYVGKFDTPDQLVHGASAESHPMENFDWPPEGQ